MARFSDLPARAQLGIFVAVAAALAAGGYFGVIQKMYAENQRAHLELKTLSDHNRVLEQYLKDTSFLQGCINQLEEQQRRQATIVPDQKEIDAFMHKVQQQARDAGIEIRRYTTRAPNTQGYFIAVPFEIELDGPYWAMLNFFERTTRLDRMMVVSNLVMANTQRGTDAKAKRKYPYTADETVVATAVLTTFYLNPNPPKPGGKPGEAAANAANMPAPGRPPECPKFAPAATAAPPGAKI